MAHRLSRIVTRTGDDGTTGLANRQRVPKESARIEAIGCVDELNCALGLLRSAPLPRPVASCVCRLQQQLFDLGAELSLPGARLIRPARVLWVERQVERFNAGLPPLREFLVPGGGTASASAHLARAICRRAERRCWALARLEPVGSSALRYLNRLSDLLFVLARLCARAQAEPEPLWRHQRRGTGPSGAGR